jgi:hypothetical protein
VLAIGGEDLRALPLSMRKTNLERLLRTRPIGGIAGDADQTDRTQGPLDRDRRLKRKSPG